MTVGGCGDNAPAGNTCGAGTTEVDGECVATTTCGTGTVDDGAGNCVPDGSVVCTDGTMFDMATGTCVPSSDVCGDGTVLVDGVCQDPSVVTPDATEAPEPNDDDEAGIIMVPAVGADGFVVNGCITPRDNGETEDVDIWFFQVQSPMVLDIAADGVGGLAAGFYVVNADGNDALDSYVRFGVNLLSDSAKRQVYIPAGGVYALVMTDQRSLFGLGAAGNEDTCYYTTIKQVALPTPVPLTLPVQTGTDNGNVQVFRYTSSAEGTILRSDMTTDSTQLDPAWVALRQNAFVGLATDLNGASAGAARFVGAVNNTQTVDIVVDMEFNAAIAPQPFEIESYAISAAPLPTDGTPVTVTAQNGVNPRDPLVDPTLHSTLAIVRNANYYYFDVGSDAAVVHFDLSATEQAVYFIARTDLVDHTFGSLDFLVLKQDAGPLDFTDQFVRFLSPGRYYVGVIQLQAGITAGHEYELTSSLTAQNAAAINVGDTIDDAAISDVTGSSWRTFTSTADWVQMTGGGQNLGGNLEVLYYPRDFEGWLANDPLVDEGDIFSDRYFDQVFSEDGTDDPVGRILLNYPGKPFLVRFRSTDGADPNELFDFAIAQRSFTDLGTPTEATPATATNVAVPSGDFVRFLVRAPRAVNIEVTSTEDIAIERLDYDEFPVDGVDDNGGGGEELDGQRPQWGYVAFHVFNFGDDDMVNVTVTTLDPTAFVEICPSRGGNGTLVVSGDDELSAARTLPFTFSLFGSDVTNYKVSTNGWLTFNTTVTDSFSSAPAGIPSAAGPNGVIAGYWDDLVGEVCVREDNNRTIIEWNGITYYEQTNVHAQVSIYNTGGRVEWVYGSAQQADGFFAVGGIENLAGTTGYEVFNDSSSFLAPGYGDVVILP